MAKVENNVCISMASTGLAQAVWGQDYRQVLKLDSNPGERCFLKLHAVDSVGVFSWLHAL